ncbi:FecCD family ABC transporter permease [Paenibacillus silvisoli]|uniref:FecCD family ABC transporter permease n=1 Tax=Paenibacillus silvisoli TaxID=3110539 RepID=UPI002805011A|nr:iron ABC transporter permease [Paenibacillus silvisoli]
MMNAAFVKKQRVTLAALFLLIIATFAVGMRLGDASIPFSRMLPTLFGQGSFKENFVLFDIRLPRLIITLLSGMALALSGSILQGITRNDLADPGVIGINSGAGLAISVFFLYVPIEEPGSFTYLIPLVGFAGALLTTLLIYLFAYSRGEGLQPVKLVLVGVGFAMALSGAMIVVISSADRMKVDFIAKWLAGNIWGTDWPFIWALLPWLVLLIPYTLYKANALNLLSLNESSAIGSGVAVNRERIVLLIVSVALAAAAVSVTGGIAFVGLMAPHIARALVGTRVQLFMPVSILMGGWLLLLADTVGRNLVDPDGIPAGIMIALIGGPYFLYLLLKK